MPVAGATVTVKPDDPDGRGATGRTDDDGKYRMTTFAVNDGGIPGEYSVTVTKGSALKRLKGMLSLTWTTPVMTRLRKNRDRKSQR